MSVFERINAIRKMLNVPEETEPLQLPNYLSLGFD